MTNRQGIPDKIDATPTKSLFIDILTRDISLEGCILDLVDNSVDSYIRNEITDRREIRLDISEDKFKILDNCGGIEHNHLKHTVFRFGTDALKGDKPTLGIYGIGMKRAILKIGKKILMETDDGNSYCRVDLDIDEWIESKSWEIPFEYFKDSGLSPGEKPYTRIEVTDLYPGIRKKFALNSFVNNIRDTKIKITYALFIADKIDFFVNDDIKIPQFVIEARYDDLYRPVKHQDSFEDVNFEIICFIDPRKGRRERELGKREGVREERLERLLQ